MSGTRWRRSVGLAALSILAALLYSSFLLSYLLDSGEHADFVSELERPGAPYAGVYRTCDVVAGLALVALAWMCRPGSGARRSEWGVCGALAAVGIGSLLDGGTSMDCESGSTSTCELNAHSVGGLLQQLLVGHTLSGLLGFIAAAIGAACCARAAAFGTPRAVAAARWMRLHIVLAAGMGLCGLADLAFLLADAEVGAVERARVLMASLWIVAVPWTIRSVRAHRPAVERHTAQVSS